MKPASEIICSNAFSVINVVQAPVMKMYPALLSMTAGTYFFGWIQVGILGVISAGKLHFANFRLTSMAQIIGVLYAVSFVQQFLQYNNAATPVSCVILPLFRSVGMRIFNKCPA